jgi:hypothetical protein
LRGVPKRGCHGLGRRKLLYVEISPSNSHSAGTVGKRIRLNLAHHLGLLAGSKLASPASSRQLRQEHQAHQPRRGSA